MNPALEELKMNPALAEATDAERLRFFIARKEDVMAATKMLCRYLEWRKRTLPLADNEPRLGVELPEWMICHGKARDETPILHVQGAMYDPEAGTAKQYANATAQLLDDNLDRNSMQKVSLLVDVRGDAGWKNPKGSQFIPVVRALSKLLGDCFPERLKRLIIYPMPWTGMALWGAVKPFIDPTTASKVVMLPGPSRPGAPCPVELAQYVDYEEIREDRRHRHTSLLHAADTAAPGSEEKENCCAAPEAPVTAAKKQRITALVSRHDS